MAKQLTFSYKVSEKTQKEMIEYFKDKKREKTPPYAIFQANEADTVITLYESGKVVFQGISADIDAESSLAKEIKQLQYDFFSNSIPLRFISLIIVDNLVIPRSVNAYIGVILPNSKIYSFS